MARAAGTVAEVNRIYKAAAAAAGRACVYIRGLARNNSETDYARVNICQFLSLARKWFFRVPISAAPFVGRYAHAVLRRGYTRGTEQNRRARDKTNTRPLKTPVVRASSSQ